MESFSLSILFNGVANRVYYDLCSYYSLAMYILHIVYVRMKEDAMYTISYSMTAGRTEYISLHKKLTPEIASIIQGSKQVSHIYIVLK